MRFGGSNLFSRSKRVIKEKETRSSSAPVFDFSFLDFSFPRNGSHKKEYKNSPAPVFEHIQEAEIIEESSEGVFTDQNDSVEEPFYTLTAEQRRANAEFELHYNWQQYSPFLFRGRILDSTL